MSKFIPKDFIEVLEYDFTDYGGQAGPIQEPSTGTVNKFFNNIKKLGKQVSKLKGSIKDFNIEEMTEEQLAEQLASVDEASEGAADFQEKMLEYIAELCGAQKEFKTDEHGNRTDEFVMVGGAPSYQELERLPYRVLQAFNQWVMKEITPKKTTPGTKS